MEIIYRTIDGKEFTDEACAYFYEKTLMDKLRMFGYKGNTCHSTREAAIVILADKDAAKTFLSKAKAEGDHCPGINEGDIGIFYWNSDYEEYCHLGCTEERIRQLHNATEAAMKMFGFLEKEEEEEEKIDENVSTND